ncbi:MAG: hypothetical protein L3J16_00970 [Anaerolineales bacterium]|nr:hypothetical protein [Anaerolineales bacterium]
MSDNEKTMFHNEDAIFRIAMWSNIVAWIALVLSLVVFSNTAYSIVSNWEMVKVSLPAGTFERIAAFAGVFLEPIVGGVFVFLVLRGLSQALYFFMDGVYEDDEEFEVVEVESAE